MYSAYIPYFQNYLFLICGFQREKQTNKQTKNSSYAGKRVFWASCHQGKTTQQVKEVSFSVHTDISNQRKIIRVIYSCEPATN